MPVQGPRRRRLESKKRKPGIFTTKHTKHTKGKRKNIHGLGEAAEAGVKGKGSFGIKEAKHKRKLGRKKLEMGFSPKCPAPCCPLSMKKGPSGGTGL
jgi:hypothetical protein